MRWLFVLQDRRESKNHKHEKTGSAGQSRSFQATLPPLHASTKAATAHCSIIVSFCHMMAKVCAVKREYWLEPCCLAQGSDDTWLLEGNSSIVQRIVAKILKSPEKPMISRLLEILSLDSLLTIHPGILHCRFQRSTTYWRATVHVFSFKQVIQGKHPAFREVAVSFQFVSNQNMWLQVSRTSPSHPTC